MKLQHLVFLGALAGITLQGSLAIANEYDKFVSKRDSIFEGPKPQLQELEGKWKCDGTAMTAGGENYHFMHYPQSLTVTASGKHGVEVSGIVDVKYENYASLGEEDFEGQIPGVKYFLRLKLEKGFLGMRRRLLVFLGPSSGLKSLPVGIRVFGTVYSCSQD